MKLPDLKKLNRRRIKEILVPIVLGYVLLHVFLFSNQRHLMYSPEEKHLTAASVGLNAMMAIVVIPSDMSSSIEGWYKEPTDPSKPVILYFHDDGVGIAGRADVAQRFIKEGYGLMLAEYRGYSGNPGSPKENGFYKDAEAYFKWLTVDQGIQENRIIIYGEGMGSGVATYLSSKHLNVAGMILDGAFSTLTEVKQRSLPGVIVPLVYLDSFDNMEKISNVVCPILFLHGGRDRVVPQKFAQKLFNAANQPKTMRVYPSGGQGDLYNAGAMNDVKAFITTLNRG